jgi:hypothetical protein
MRGLGMIDSISVTANFGLMQRLWLFEGTGIMFEGDWNAICVSNE